MWPRFPNRALMALNKARLEIAISNRSHIGYFDDFGKTLGLTSRSLTLNFQ
jgi:hypothetical protein